MRRSRKFLAMLLGAAMLLTMTAGMMPATMAQDAPVEITIALWEVDTSFLEKDDAVYKYVCDKLGIIINPIAMTWDDYTEKVNTWVATDDMPEVFSIDLQGTKTLRSWVRDELIRPMPEDLSPYPNLSKLFALPSVAVTAIDGKFWNIPRANADMSEYDSVPARGIYYRKDWAEKLGLSEPATVDEFIDFVRAMVNGDPNGDGGNIVGITSYDWYFLAYPIWKAIEPRWFTSWQLDENGVGYIAYDAEHSFEAANTIRLMYNEGLIDPDIAIQTTDAGFDKFAMNKAALVAFQMHQNDHYLFDKFVANNPDKNIEDCIGYLKPLQNKYDGNYYFMAGGKPWSESYISYKVSDEKFEKILQVLDYFASPEWFDIARYGLEGVDYQRDADGGITYLTEDGLHPDLRAKYPFLSGFKFLTLWDLGASFIPVDSRYPYSTQMITEYYEWTVANGTMEPYTVAFDGLSTPASEEYIDEAWTLLPKFMFSRFEGDPEAEWAAMQETFRANGLDAMLEEMNQAARNEGRLP